MTAADGIYRNGRPRIVVIGGPTGVGKTSAAIAVAEAFGGEIVGADSMQIYRFMDIGTAKPTPEEQARVRHHLIDILNPDDPFDAARYAETAGGVIKRLHEERVLPLVAGGTGLYIKALIHGIFQARPADPAVRERLKKEAEERGSAALYERLRRKDPEAAGRLHPNDAFRIIRALEVREATGKPLSAHHGDHRFGEAPFDALKIGLTLPRETLYERIDRRVDIMIAEGLLEEVKALMEMGYGRDLKSMQSIGYRHMAAWLAGDLTWAEAVRTLKRDTRRYAKRQLTWFRADPDMAWHSPEETAAIKDRVAAFLEGPSV